MADKEKMRQQAVAHLCARTGWTTDVAWEFLHELPYSTIPDQGDAVRLLGWLEDHPWEER